jgi:hypothetical protein
VSTEQDRATVDGLLRPTPTVTHDDWRGTVPAFRLDAYYYDFGSTGLEVIDLILSAVACAGKAFHHTEQWNDDCSPYHDKLRGDSPAEWINNAAHDAAVAIRSYAERLAQVQQVPDEPDNQWIGDVMILTVLMQSDCVNEQEREVLARWIAAPASPGEAAQTTQSDEDTRWTIDRAADFLEQYAAFIHREKPDDLEQHPYLPELEMVAGQLRHWFDPAQTTQGEPQ